MANLKGSTHKKQINDALIRLDARGTPRYGANKKSNLAHSNSIRNKRGQSLRRFANYAKDKNFTQKLNQAITKENILDYFSEIFHDLAPSSVENYISTFSALVEGLRYKNITIDPRVDYYFFQRCKDAFLGRPNDKEFVIGRYINQEKFNTIHAIISEKSKVVAQLQYLLGFRAEEALNIANNLTKFLRGGKLIEVPGKGGQHYPPKDIAKEFVKEIQSISGITRDVYYRHIRQALSGNRAHDFRVSFAINHYNKLINKGILRKEALKMTSEELNHHRESMTLYYLARA